MSHNKADFIIEQGIANIVVTITKLNEFIVQEEDEKRLNELKIKRGQLMQVLKELAIDHSKKP